MTSVNAALQTSNPGTPRIQSQRIVKKIMEEIILIILL
jgi:hypothetical protein